MSQNFIFGRENKVEVWNVKRGYVQYIMRMFLSYIYFFFQTGD